MRRPMASKYVDHESTFENRASQRDPPARYYIQSRILQLGRMHANNFTTHENKLILVEIIRNGR